MKLKCLIQGMGRVSQHLPEDAALCGPSCSHSTLCICTVLHIVSVSAMCL